MDLPVINNSGRGKKYYTLMVIKIMYLLYLIFSLIFNSSDELEYDNYEVTSTFGERKVYTGTVIVLTLIVQTMLLLYDISINIGGCNKHPSVKKSIFNCFMIIYISHNTILFINCDNVMRPCIRGDRILYVQFLLNLIILHLLVLIYVIKKISNCYRIIRDRRNIAAAAAEIPPVNNHQIDINGNQITYQNEKHKIQSPVNHEEIIYGTYDVTDVYNRHETCPICTDDFIEYSSISRLGCGHYYHHHCIDEWKLKKSTCPLCAVKVKDSEVNDAAENSEASDESENSEAGDASENSDEN